MCVLFHGWQRQLLLDKRKRLTWSESNISRSQKLKNSIEHVSCEAESFCVLRTTRNVQLRGTSVGELRSGPILRAVPMQESPKCVCVVHSPRQIGLAAHISGKLTDQDTYFCKLRLCGSRCDYTPPYPSLNVGCFQDRTELKTGPISFETIPQAQSQ